MIGVTVPGFKHHQGQVCTQGIWTGTDFQQGFPCLPIGQGKSTAQYILGNLFTDPYKPQVRTHIIIGPLF